MSELKTNTTDATSSSSTSRWSDASYTNMDIPSYIPPEAFTHLQGQFLRGFLLCALVHDLRRMIATNTCSQYFDNLPLDPVYNSAGERTNTPEEVLRNKRMEAIQEMSELLSVFDERYETKGKEILRKIMLQREHMETGAWGAIIGARGAVHQGLEKKHNCRIVLAGRGITDPMKDSNVNALIWAQEDPHVRISANNEKELQEAVEEIEWILSDDPVAVEFRERNRRRTARLEGRYDPRTWVSSTDASKRGGEAGSRSGVGEKHGRDDEVESDKEDLDEFLAEVDE